jgi:thiamine kinase-like enzyme
LVDTSTVNEARIRARVASLLPGSTPDSIAALRYLEGGYSNSNWRFEHAGEAFVVRIPHARQAHTDPNAEVALIADLPRDLVPEVVAFDPDDGTLITRWVDGELLAAVTAPPATTLAGQLHRIHTALPPLRRVYDPLATARAWLADGHPPRWIEALARTSWRPAAIVTCHNDLNAWNLIVTTAGSWVVLDWETAGANDPLFDLATLGFGVGLDDGAFTQLAARFVGAPVEHDRLERCTIAYWLREYAFAFASRAAGIRRAEIDAQLERADLRLRQLSS